MMGTRIKIQIVSEKNVTYVSKHIVSTNNYVIEGMCSLLLLFNVKNTNYI